MGIGIVAVVALAIMGLRAIPPVTTDVEIPGPPQIPDQEQILDISEDLKALLYQEPLELSEVEKAALGYAPQNPEFSAYHLAREFDTVEGIVQEISEDGVLTLIITAGAISDPEARIATTPDTIFAALDLSLLRAGEEQGLVPLTLEDLRGGDTVIVALAKDTKPPRAVFVNRRSSLLNEIEL